MELNYRGKKSVSNILKQSQSISYTNKKYNSPYKHNYIFYGDNFPILSFLNNHNLHNKVDLIYIDPPFATNNKFTVNHNRVSTISRASGITAYNDNLTGSGYIEFLRERLILMKQLLSKCGSIYVHINDIIGPYVKVIMDEIFGADNYLNLICRRKSNPKNFHRRAFGNDKDIILYYAKNKGYNIFNNIREPFSTQELKCKYKQKDSRGRYNTVPLHAPGVSHGASGSKWKGMLPPAGRHWRSKPRYLTKLDNEGLIQWSKTGNPRLKKYAKDNKGRKIQDIWLNYKDKPYPKYPTQKNQSMLNMIIKQSSKPNSIVLDAFAGSGSTLKSAEKYGRHFIGIDKSKFAIQVMRKRFQNNLFSNTIFC